MSRERGAARALVALSLALVLSGCIPMDDALQAIFGRQAADSFQDLANFFFGSNHLRGSSPCYAYSAETASAFTSSRGWLRWL